MQTIYFDMDGTIADLYGVENWLKSLRAERVEPYARAKPLMDSKLIENIKENYNLKVLTWTAKNSTKKYHEQVATTKEEWIKKHFSNLFSEVIVLPYGTNKANYLAKGDILIDDDYNNLKECRKKNKRAILPKTFINRVMKGKAI